MGEKRRKQHKPPEQDWEMMDAFLAYYQAPDTITRWDNMWMFLALGAFKAGYKAGKAAQK